MTLPGQLSKVYLGVLAKDIATIQRSAKAKAQFTKGYFPSASLFFNKSISGTGLGSMPLSMAR